MLVQPGGESIPAKPRQTRPPKTAKLMNTIQLIEKMARLISQEATALGVNHLMGPVVDLARELRFGRVSLILHFLNRTDLTFICRSKRHTVKTHTLQVKSDTTIPRGFKVSMSPPTSSTLRDSPNPNKV